MDTPKAEYRELTVEQPDFIATVNQEAQDGWQVVSTREYAGRKPSRAKLLGIPLSWMPAVYVHVILTRPSHS
jgi:hypothetical protein